MNTTRFLTPALLLGAMGLAHAADAPVTSAAQVESVLRDAGHGDIRDIERDDDGVWEAEVRAPSGGWYEVHVVSATGEVLDREARPVLDREEIRAVLEAAGYRDIHELERDHAVWEADARSADGRWLELTVNGHTGEVVHEELDLDD